MRSACIDSKASRSRDLVAAMVARKLAFEVAARIFAPEASKLAMPQAWADTTLADDLGVADAHEDELYEAMDWLSQFQETIEQRLAKRHLKSGGLVLFDLTSMLVRAKGLTQPMFLRACGKRSGHYRECPKLSAGPS